MLTSFVIPSAFWAALGFIIYYVIYIYYSSAQALCLLVVRHANYSLFSSSIDGIGWSKHPAHHVE